MERICWKGTQLGTETHLGYCGKQERAKGNRAKEKAVETVKQI